MMVRNGPNPVFEPVAHYYWLDGDSMIHAIHFENGEATYVSRYVRTSRFKQEQYHGKAQFLQYGDLHGAFGLFMACMQLLREKLGVLDMSHGWANAHTGVIYHNMLMILQDWDHPYAINVLENKDLYTLGINNYNKRLGHSLNPHPKKDPITGELFILGSSNTLPVSEDFGVVSQERRYK
ncbi:hypothetical protein Leryth_025391 [Lithospermum erythrorhizon]|nr:hypothetical protein Leryth_025391 [Lithospermum erythrorhizon]